MSKSYVCYYLPRVIEKAVSLTRLVRPAVCWRIGPPHRAHQKGTHPYHAHLQNSTIHAKNLIIISTVVQGLAQMQSCYACSATNVDLTKIKHIPNRSTPCNPIIFVLVASSSHHHTIQQFKVPLVSKHAPVNWYHLPTPYKISFSCCLCAGLNVDGKLTLYLMTKSPRWPGFLEIGMPKPGYRSSLPGCVGPPLSRLICLPSIVVTVRFHPVRASLRSKVTKWMRSLSSRLKRGCSFYRVVSIKSVHHGVERMLLTSSTIKCKSCLPPST